MSFEIPYWFDKIISISGVGERFKEKRIDDSLQQYDMIKGKKYVAFSNPFSERLDYYVTRNELEHHTFSIIDHYGIYCTTGPNNKLILPIQGNQLIKLKDGFYYFTFNEDEPIGSTYARIVIFVDQENLIWDKEKITKVIYDFSKELSQFQDKKREENSDPTAFDRIFLPGDMIENIKLEVSNFLESRSLYADDLKLPWKRGILLSGRAGNGKTSLLRAICKYFGLDFRDIKEAIKRNGDVELPKNEQVDMVLFPTGNDATVWIMEDIDKMVDFNGDKESLSSSVSLHDILKGLDGINQVDGVLILATTNFADILTESLAARPGRFDRIIEILPPEKSEILKLLDFYKMKISDDENGLDRVASKLKGLSMAFAEEYVKSVKMVYKRNIITEEESDAILKKIIKHNKDFENNFAEEKGGFGFGK